MLTLQLMTMGCGISKSSRSITPAKGEGEGSPLAWSKSNGLSTSPNHLKALANGHTKMITDSGVATITQNSAGSIPGGGPLDGLSTYSKQDSMGLFDLVGRMTAISTTDTIDSTAAPPTEKTDSAASGSGTSRKTISSLRQNSGDLGLPVDKDLSTDTVVNKLLELQQLLGPNIFQQPPNGINVHESKAKYIVVESKTKKKSNSKPQTKTTERKEEREEVTGSESSEASQDTVDAAKFPADLWDGDLERALSDINAKSSKRKCRRPRVNAGIQTDNDPVTDEAPEYAARPPNSRKVQLVENPDAFAAIDAHAFQTPDTSTTSLENLVNYLIIPAKNDLDKIRAFFVWIALNISYDWQFADQQLTTEEILEKRAGVCKEYCKLFSEMCRLCDIRVKKLHGFAKGFDFRPGHCFQPDEEITHAWNVVFVMGSWRFVDCTWGAGFTDSLGRFQRRMNEHFFLTDPDQLIWTHFPYDDLENNYRRWQLLDSPLSLEEFNARPKVTAQFFNYNLRIRQHVACPVLFSQKVDIQIKGVSFMRYKYKFYPRTSSESTAFNKWVFCHFKDKRMVASFNISPPEAGEYYLKIYSRPEHELQSTHAYGGDNTPQASTSGGTANNITTNSTQNGNLNLVAMFLLNCIKPLQPKAQRPLPVTDVPWGPTQAFYDFGMKMASGTSSVIPVHGAHGKFVFEISHKMLTACQMFNSDGVEVKFKPTNFSFYESATELRYIFSSPGLGYYKFLVYALPKPNERGRWKLPLVASLLIDVQTRETYIVPDKKKKKKTPQNMMIVGAMRH